jgi:very-short-patch-repair endonuclease
MTHLSVPDERKAALGISDNLVRISIGVEDPDDSSPTSTKRSGRSKALTGDEMRGTTKSRVARARALRRVLSPAEARLWSVLRTRPSGVKFRRQHAVAAYVLDFYCPSAKLRIKVDGIAHDMGDNSAPDKLRDAVLGRRGIAVLRIPAAELTRGFAGVVALIEQHCRARSSSLSRSDGEGDRPKGGGGAD